MLAVVNNLKMGVIVTTYPSPGMILQVIPPKTTYLEGDDHNSWYHFLAFACSLVKQIQT